MKVLSSLQKFLRGRDDPSRFQIAGPPAPGTSSCLGWPSFPGPERISAGSLLADYRPYRTRHPQESGPRKGDASTHGNIPTGVALINKSHWKFDACGTSFLDSTFTFLRAFQRCDRGFGGPAGSQNNDGFAYRIEPDGRQAPPSRHEHPCCRQSICRRPSIPCLPLRFGAPPAYVI